MDQKTPLYDRHVALCAKIVPFAGWLMPVQYKAGVIAEHMAVRTKCGLFDVSHMGEFSLKGADALLNLNHWLTNDFSTMADHQVRYSPMCNAQGGVVDDLVVYRFSACDYMIVVNAANRAKDFAHMREHLTGDAVLTDVSDALCEIALQGPLAKEILGALCDASALPAKYYHFTEGVQVAGIDCLISRTGYTGEFGYELYASASAAVPLWDALLAAGEPLGLLPCGLGARDTLRLEAAMPLYGHEMSDEISPIETGLSWAVKPDTHDFIGRVALLEKGAPRCRIGLKVTGKGIVREAQDVYAGDQIVGRTTSGTYLPYLAGAYAMALVKPAYAAVGQALSADVRGRRVDCEVVPLPFYKREKKS